MHVSVDSLAFLDFDEHMFPSIESEGEIEYEKLNIFVLKTQI